MKAVLAIDSFKGCLTSAQAEEAARQGILSQVPHCEIHAIPLSDGGEGLMQVLLPQCGGDVAEVWVHDPLMRPLKASYGLSADHHTAYIEMAAASGLPLLQPSERNPLITTTYGTGEQIAHALAAGCRHFVVGLGGSATNDAGLGMLQALGYRFLDPYGQQLQVCGGNLQQIASVETAHVLPQLAECTFQAACDVRNPFAGSEGAAYIFSPQKGADAETVRQLDEGLRHVARVIQAETGIDVLDLPGAGAAGGMGGGMVAFLHAELRSGADLLLELSGFDAALQDADFVITGEGQSDAQTLMGKLPSAVLRRAQAAGVPVVLLSGAVDDVALLNDHGFAAVLSVQQGPVTLAEAMHPDTARQGIRIVSAQVARLLAQASIRHE